MNLEFCIKTFLLNDYRQMLQRTEGSSIIEFFVYLQTEMI